MKKYLNSLNIIAFVGILNIVGLFIIFYSSGYINISGIVDTNASSAFGTLLGGLVAPYALIITYLIFKNQKKEIAKQNFESNFISIINSYYNLVNSIYFPVFNKKAKEAISEFEKLFRKKYAELKQSKQTNSNELLNNLGKDTYDLISKEYGVYFNQYFKFVKFVLETIKSQNDINKKYYLNNFQSHLSDSELFLIFFHAVANSGKASVNDKSYYFLVWECDIIKNIREDALLERCNSEIYPLMVFDFYTDKEKSDMIKKKQSIAKKLKRILK
ncbi:MAG: putative phage abortive infection protein [Bacteroidia bacterium]